MNSLFPLERSVWSLPPDVVPFNHGSFGPTPVVVQEAREDWSRRLASQPMRFFLQEAESELDNARKELAKLVGSSAQNLVFVDNATFAMNIVAATVRLQPGDEVLLNDHEYGAVFRIWRTVAERAGAKVITATLPLPLTNDDEIVASLMNRVTPQTRLIVCSHVTSPTAVILPIQKIAQAAAKLEIPLCVDGPHAIAMRELNLKTLGCDFYCASLHKWLAAPLGSGFLWAHPRWHAKLQSPLISWGRSLGGVAPNWRDDFQWWGTRDPAPCLAVPAAIQFLKTAGWTEFREWTHQQVRQAADVLKAEFGATPLVPDSPDWYGSMITLALPSQNAGQKPFLSDPLQKALADEFQIELPIVWWRETRHLRLSWYLYNTSNDLDKLVEALKSLLKRFP